MLPKKFIPVNRRILIVPHFSKEKEDRGFILPESYKEEQRHISATVLRVAADCAKCFKSLQYQGSPRELIVDRSMIEEISHNEKTHYVILENHVVAIVAEQYGELE